MIAVWLANCVRLHCSKSYLQRPLRRFLLFFPGNNYKVALKQRNFWNGSSTLTKHVRIRDGCLSFIANFLPNFIIFKMVYNEDIDQIDVIPLARLPHASEFVIFESCLIWKFVGLLNYLEIKCTSLMNNLKISFFNWNIKALAPHQCRRQSKWSEVALAKSGGALKFAYQNWSVDRTATIMRSLKIRPAALLSSFCQGPIPPDVQPWFF